MGDKLKIYASLFVGIIGFIASVTGIESWLGLTLHLGAVYVPNLIIIIVAVLIAILLFASFFCLGGYIVFWGLLMILIGHTHTDSVRPFSSLYHLVKNKSKIYIGTFVGIVGFIASVIGIAGWLGFALHLGDVYVPNPIIFIVAIFIVVLLSIGFFHFGTFVIDSFVNMPLTFPFGIFFGPSVRDVVQLIAGIKRTREEQQLITEIERIEAEKQQDQQ